MKSIPSPPGVNTEIKCPLRTVYFASLFVNIDQIHLIWGMFSGQNEIKSPAFARRGVGGGNTLIGALFSSKDYNLERELHHSTVSSLDNNSIIILLNNE